jgi:hypothetical protein
MLGTANIKVRPIKLALMVDPNSALQVREAIRLARLAMVESDHAIYSGRVIA